MILEVSTNNDFFESNVVHILVYKGILGSIPKRCSV